MNWANNNHNSSASSKLLVQERRREVASLLAQSLTETEIAIRLGVAQPTISNDVKALKQMASQFIFDLAKSDLAYFYKQCIDGIEQVQRKAWIFVNSDSNSEITPKERLIALRLAKDCNVEKFAIFKEGPSVMNIVSLEDRMNKIEDSGQISR